MTELSHCQRTKLSERISQNSQLQKLNLQTIQKKLIQTTFMMPAAQQRTATDEKVPVPVRSKVH